VRLDLDAPRLEADERMGDGAREHTSSVRTNVSRNPHGSEPTSHQVRLR
jgi:hypothetical protein